MDPLPNFIQDGKICKLSGGGAIEIDFKSELGSPAFIDVNRAGAQGIEVPFDRFSHRVLEDSIGVRNMREKSEEQERVVSVAQALVSIVF